MHRNHATGRRPTDILSAILLCLAAALAVVYGPLTSAAPFPPALTGSAGSMGGADQHTAPVNHKRPFVAVEWQSAKALAAQDEGKSKAILPPPGAAVPEPSLESRHDVSVGYAGLSAPTHRYDARAPPAFS